MPNEIMPRGILAPSMIAHLLAMKYVLGVPFHRYEQQTRARDSRPATVLDDYHRLMNLYRLRTAIGTSRG